MDVEEMLEPIEKELVGETMEIGGYTVQPVAKMQGKVWQTPEGEAEGAFVRLVPAELRVQDAGGNEQRLDLTPKIDPALKGMASGAAAIAAACIAILFVARLWALFYPTNRS